MPEQIDSVMRLQEAYANLYNEITQPDKVFVATQYFRRNWVPRLGHALSWLIIALRQHCYWNKRTGEKRDWCLVTQEELAQEIGVTPKTVRRLLQHEHAGRFIVEVENRYRYDNQLGKLVRKHSFYRVRMDDPLIPEDEERLRQRLADELAGLRVDPETGQRDMLKLLDRMIDGDLGDEDDLPDKMSGRWCPEPVEGSEGHQGNGDPGISETNATPDLPDSAEPPVGEVSTAVPVVGVVHPDELENLTLTDDQVLVRVYADSDSGEDEQELFSVRSLAEVVKRDIRSAGRYSPDIGLLYRREVYYSVEHALGQDSDNWTEEEGRKIGKRNKLEQELGERFNRLGAFSLEEALHQYFSPELRTRFLAGQPEAELRRIEGWVAYTRKANGLTNPGGFLRSKIESSEQPPPA